MSTNNKGIDYGMGQTNKNHESGIRFGVISQNMVLQAWADESEAVYPDPECECGLEIDMDADLYTCECGEEIEPDFIWEGIEPLGFKVDDGEIKAESDSYGDIFILESPYFTYAQFCSPCAPGACHLENPLEEPSENNKAYCFGHDWFETLKAPYPVFSVETGELIIPSSTEDRKQATGLDLKAGE